MPFQTNQSNANEKQANGGSIPNDKLLQVPPQQNGATAKEPDIETPPTAEVVVPTDGGWGWVVVVASFICNLIVDGIVMSAGIFSERIGEHFQIPKSEVSSFLKNLMHNF